ncbi:MAG: aldo/keto reductase [Clostridiales bacterium]|nr:aldo/keto reductase [Clostridiales bacterium]
MRTHRFGERDVTVVALGSSDFGCLTPEALAFDLMDAYVSVGGNFIDTARVYGDFTTPREGLSEQVIGRWLSARGCRDDIFLSTKGGHPRLDTMDIGRLDRESVRSDMQASLEALRTDHVDVYWLHRDDVSRPVGDIMETLQSLVEDGYTKLLGVSNWRPRRILEANQYARDHGLTPLSANQPRFSLAEQINVEDPTLVAMDAETWRMHHDTGMVCCCFSSQAKGFLSKLDQLGAEGLSDKARRRYFCDGNLEIYRRAKALSLETGLSIGAIAVAYLTCQPFPTFALTGASKVEQVLMLSESGSAEITPEQRDALRRFA